MPDPTTTTLFRPVLIETVEQAEQLPIGTAAIDRPRGGGIPEAFVKTGGGKWMGTLDGGNPYDCAEMVGDYALVPVTATIEMARTSRTPEQSHLPIAPRGAVVWRDLGYMIATRYTTPWTPEEET